MQPITYILIDKNEFTRVGFRTLVNNNSRLTCVGDSGSINHCMTVELPSPPDVIVIAYDDSFQLQSMLPQIKQRWQSVRTFLLLEEKHVHDQAVNALSFSVDGFCRKLAPLSMLSIGIEAVAKGGFFLDPECSRLLFDSEDFRELPRSNQQNGDLPFGLSNREFDVLVHLAKARTNPQIAQILGISSETVKSHVKRILEKLNATDRNEAVRKAIRGGLHIPAEDSRSLSIYI